MVAVGVTWLMTIGPEPVAFEELPSALVKDARTLLGDLGTGSRGSCLGGGRIEQPR